MRYVYLPVSIGDSTEDEMTIRIAIGDFSLRRCRDGCFLFATKSMKLEWKFDRMDETPVLKSK